MTANRREYIIHIAQTKERLDLKQFFDDIDELLRKHGLGGSISELINPVILEEKNYIDPGIE
jgi:hypothetical protein